MTTKTPLALAGLCAMLMTSSVMAADVDRTATTGSRIKQLPALKVQDPTAEKVLVNADNSDLDAELQAILAEADAVEFD